MSEKKPIKKITLNHITKVEGHAEVNISIKDGKIEHCHVHSVEGARYFEGLIKGRMYDEVTLITSRICGICSCGHTIASIKAIENAFGMKPSLQTQLLRELVTIGERIRSHASHIYFFSLPDFLGYGNAIDMAKEYKQEVKDCLEIIRVGNEIIACIGGRDMHPFCPVVGGFTKDPDIARLQTLKQSLIDSLPLAEKCVELFASLEVPNYSRPDTVFISLDNLKTFPLHTGDIVSNTGLKFAPDQYEDFITEYFEPGSTAKFASMKGKEFMTGALARINNAGDRLTPRVQGLMKRLQIGVPSTNLFLNNLAQALEILHWTERAIEIIETHEFKPEKIAEPVLEPGKSYRGIAAIEVPRGILFHDYSFNGEGVLTDANIITPTVQNLADMEINVKTYLNQVITENPHKDKDELALEIEKMVRAFDPCFSCSTHFLKINWEEL